MKKIIIVLTAIVLFPLVISNNIPKAYATIGNINIVNNTGFISTYLQIPFDGKDSSPSYPEFNDGDLDMNTFLVVDDIIFIEDALNSRILVYRDFSFDKSIDINENHDAKLFYYDAQTDILQIVYDDLSDYQTHLYIEKYNIAQDVEIEKPKDLMKSSCDLVNYFFDDKGNLVTDYLELDVNGKPIGTENLFFIESNLQLDKYYLEPDISVDSQKKRLGIADIYNEVLYISQDKKEKVIKYSFMYDNGNGNYSFDNYIFIKENGQIVKYAKMMPFTEVFSRGMISISKENDVYTIYEMVVDEDVINIYKLKTQPICTFATEREIDQKHCLTSPTVSDCQPKEIVTINSILTLPTMYPSTVKSNMDACLNFQWTYNSTLNGNINVVPSQYRSLVTKPQWLANISDGLNHSVISIPYCYGGYYSNLSSFTSEISAGKYAGNVQSNDQHIHIPNTAGMDCSGYVSYVYNLGVKYSTSSLPQCFTQVNKNEVRPYYIINKAGDHVRIVSSASNSSGVMYVNYYEECASAGKIRIVNGQNYNNLYSAGYLPYIYNQMPSDPIGNTMATAYTVSPLSAISDSINYSMDTDVYKMTANYSGDYYFYTTGSTDTYGMVISPSGPIICSDNNSGSGSNFYISMYIYSGETYYFQVRHTGTGTGSYTAYFIHY